MPVTIKKTVKIKIKANSVLSDNKFGVDHEKEKAEQQIRKASVTIKTKTTNSQTRKTNFNG